MASANSGTIRRKNRNLSACLNFLKFVTVGRRISGLVSRLAGPAFFLPGKPNFMNLPRLSPPFRRLVDRMARP